jgi:hypothetical protein
MYHKTFYGQKEFYNTFVGPNDSIIKHNII